MEEAGHETALEDRRKCSCFQNDLEQPARNADLVWMALATGQYAQDATPGGGC